MKSLVVGAILFFSLITNAQSKVGDWASFRIKSVTVNGEVRTGTETMKVLEVTSSGHVLIHRVVIEDGPYRFDKKTWEDGDQFITAEGGQSYVDDCTHSEVDGTLQAITVPAGMFAACRVGEATGISFDWYGAVPFGMIKYVYTTQWNRNGKFIDVTLSGELADFGPK